MSAKCYIGKLLNEDCYLTFYSNDKTLYRTVDLSKDDLKLLEFRVVGFSSKIVEDICHHHVCKYLKYYSDSFKSCADPFQKHKKKIINNLKTIDLKCSENFKSIYNITLIPGQKICVNCMNKVLNQLQSSKVCYDPFNNHRNFVSDNLRILDSDICEQYLNVCGIELNQNKNVCFRCYTKIKSDISNLENQIPVSSCDTSVQANTDELFQNTPQSTSGSEYYSNSQKRKALDDVLDALDISALKRNKLPSDVFSKQLLSVLETAIHKISNAMKDVFQVSLPSFDNLQLLLEESSSFRMIINNLQSKYIKETSKSEKVRLLTLLPSEWSFKTVTCYFNCSYYMWMTSRRLKENVGMLF